MEPIRHILVATDFGPCSERALDTAAQLAIAFGAKVTMVHVLDASHRQSVDAFIGSRSSLDEARTSAAHQLKESGSSLTATGVACNSMLLEGSPSEKIVEAAAELDVDLVVVGSHGRRGLSRALLGSVAERVIRLCAPPVLTVHGFWFEDRAEAGAELGKLLGALRAESPVVLAISPEGVLAAAEVADALGARLDILLVREVREGEAVLGAVCEDGTVGLAPYVAEGALGKERTHLLSDMQASLAWKGYELRDRGIRNLWRRTVVIVSDELMDARCALLAVDVVERMGPREIHVAAPIATAAAVSALEVRVSAVTVPHVVDARVSPEAIYRDPSKVLPETIQRRLAKRAA